MRMRLTATLIMVLLAGMAFGQTGPEQRSPVTAIISRIRIVGNRRIPGKRILAAVATHAGDRFDPWQLDRDVHRIYSLGHFRDVKVFSDDDQQMVIFEVWEWPLITGIAFEGIGSDIVSMATVEWKKRGIEIEIDSEYLPQKVKPAAKVIQDFMEGRGNSDPKVDVEVENVSKDGVVVRFFSRSRQSR